MVPSAFRVLLVTPRGSDGSGGGRSASVADSSLPDSEVRGGLPLPEDGFLSDDFFPSEAPPEEGGGAPAVICVPADSCELSESSLPLPKISPTTRSEAPWPIACPKALPPSVMPDSKASPMALPQLCWRSALLTSRAAVSRIFRASRPPISLVSWASRICWLPILADSPIWVFWAMVMALLTPRCCWFSVHREAYASVAL